MKAESLASEAKEKVPARTGTRIAFMFLGWISLSGGIISFQDIIQSFGGDIKYMNLIDNWIPGIVALFFLAGWLAMHWLESALLRKQMKMARIIVISYLVGMSLTFLTFTNLVVHPVFNEMGSVSSPLMLSGFAFRCSVFRKEAFFSMQNLFFGG